MFHLPCGHSVKHTDDCVVLYILTDVSGYERQPEGSVGIMCADYCKQCADEWLDKYPDGVFTELWGAEKEMHIENGDNI